jgi:predicted nucleotide-binding protein
MSQMADPKALDYYQAMLKPRIFIGSSKEALDYAEAVHSELARTAECTVWTEGAFWLSEQNLQALVRNARGSDFAVFILSPDDEIELRGQLLRAARDNVIYESGLFSGYLGPQRCFLTVAETMIDMHLPSDLSGITVGTYENARSDENYRSAVAPFCAEVKKCIRKLGLFEGSPQEKLHDLCIKYDCCEWITETRDRVKRKESLSSEIGTAVTDRTITRCSHDSLVIVPSVTSFAMDMMGTV